MKLISHDDLENLAIGATVLGSGGGGDPTYDILIAKQSFEKFGPVRLMDINEVGPDEYIAPLAYMGAPLVSIEKLPSGIEFDAILPLAEKMIGNSIKYLIPAEIGGSNAFTPLIVAASLGMPVIDGDLIGRAFPELQITSSNLKGISPSPAILADSFGNTVVINAKNAFTVEEYCRNITMSTGSIAALCLYIMTGQQAKGSIIRNSYSYAIAIGKILRETKERGAVAIKDLMNYTKGVVLDSGTITDIDQIITDGFLKGSVAIKGTKGALKIVYQNEYLAAFQNDKPLVSTPDIITLFEEESGIPIASESLAYGLRVIAVAIPAPDIWTTAEGLKLTSPKSFGFDFEYQPICSRY